MEFSFKKKNYILLLVGLLLIITGLLLMAGGGSEDPTKYSEEIFSPRRITWGTILIVLGYIIELFAIMYTKKD